MKKIIAGVASICISFNMLTIPALAKEENVMLISSKPQVSEADELKSVLLKVKDKIDIPEELSEFSYSFNYSSGNYANRQIWNLTWRDKEYNKNVNVKVTSDGHILGYSKYDGKRENTKPTYLKDELVKNASDFIKNIVSEFSENIILKSSEFSGVYSGAYLYTFERIENGIRMPDDKITVSVNYETGEVVSYNANWTLDVVIPDSNVNITIDDAREKIGENVNMELKYMSKTEEVDGKQVTKAYLVYVPDRDYVAIDAKTGEIYDTHDEFLEMDKLENSVAQSMGANMALKEEGVLTEQEIAKIDEMKELITKEQAISVVTSMKDVLLLDDNAKSVDARLIQKYNYEDKDKVEYIWNLHFNDPRNVDYNTKDYYRAYANATVDAKTGNLLSFSSSVRDYYDDKDKEWESVKVKYTEAECKNVFEKFVKDLESEKFSNTILSDSSDTAYLLKYINNEPVYGGYSYSYSRVNEGVEYSYNRISGKVDGVTGKIYSYNVNWTNNIEFESPKDAMTEKEAYKAYSEKDGFELVYEINNKHYIESEPKTEDYDKLYVLEKEVRLVYRTDIKPQYISPFTGEQLDYSGKVYENVSEKEYLDVDGFWGERSIKLITDMGYTFEGDNFMPDKVITKDELFSLLQIVGEYINSKEYEDLEKITKLDAVKLLINQMGLKKVAELSDIYKASFKDISQVENEDIGYIALAKGLGIISGDSNGNFNSKKELTRIEAVCMVLKLANVR